jgi:hypothetical protein
MNLLTRYEQSISRIDKNYALVIGILSAITAVWMVFRLVMLGLSAIAFSSYGVSAFSLAISFVWTLAILALAAFNAYVFLRRYRQP